MIKILNTALALAAVGSLAFAGTTGSDWTGLDKDMSLATADSHMKGGPSMGALIRSSLDFSGDDGYTIGVDEEDLQGITFQNAVLWAQGDIGNFWWRLSFDFASGSGIPDNGAGDGIGGASLEDAYAKWSCNDQISVTMGQFKAPVSRSNSISDGSLMFIDRTLVGQVFDSYDPGLMVGGSFEQFCWDVALQNGADGASEDFAMSARGEYAFNGGAGCCEGGYGKKDGTTGSIGLGYWNDSDDLVDGSVVVVDGSVSFSRFTVMAEFANFDEEVAPGLPYGSYTDDASVWALGVSYMLQPEEWEVAVRMQDCDDDDDSSIITAGLNWYHGGHNAKWQLNVSDYSSDVSAAEGTLIQVGLTLGCLGC
jgi:hypothetical protein